MARKSGSNSSKGSGGKTAKAFQDYSFLKHTLSSEEKAALQEYDPEPAEFFGLLDRFVDDDYKLSVAKDTYNNCITASVTCRDKENPDYGLILTGRAPSVYDAIRVVLFKHTQLLGGDWLAFHEREDEGDVWA